jgi:hypothetical protein
VKIAANICGFIHAFFDIERGTRPIIYKLCIQIMDCITQQDFTRWHSANKERLPHLPYLFLNMLQHVFAQQAKFLANTFNTNKVEHGNNGSTLNVKQLKQTVKYISRFFKKMSDHVAEDSIPDSVPRFTPCHALLSNQVCTVIDAVAAVTINAGDTKKKQDSSPPGTPACERRAKKACGGNKPTRGGPDQAKLGLFHAKEGVKPEELFPGDLESTPCAFFCSQDKKCNRPHSSCPQPHVVKWENIKPGNQKKILVHFGKTGNGWFDAKTMKKHNADVPAEYSYLLGDASRPTQSQKYVKYLLLRAGILTYLYRSKNLGSGMSHQYRFIFMRQNILWIFADHIYFKFLNKNEFIAFVISDCLGAVRRVCRHIGRSTIIYYLKKFMPI